MYSTSFTSFAILNSAALDTAHMQSSMNYILLCSIWFILVNSILTLSTKLYTVAFFARCSHRVTLALTRKRGDQYTPPVLPSSRQSSCNPCSFWHIMWNLFVSVIRPVCGPRLGDKTDGWFFSARPYPCCFISHICSFLWSINTKVSSPKTLSSPAQSQSMF